METTRPRIELTSERLDEAYRRCRQWVHSHLRPWLWIGGNLPGERRRALHPLLYHTGRCLEMLNLESDNGLSLDVWAELRDDTSDAFRDQYTSLELMALVDACRRFNVPKQYLFDQLDGADYWIRFHHFETYDELDVFAYRMGGAPLTAAVPIIGFIKPDYEIPAIRMGKAVFLTQMLAGLYTDAKAKRVFIPREDLVASGLDLERFKLRQSTAGLSRLVQMFTDRILELMEQSVELLAYLDFDARRSIQSLIAVHWTMVRNMRKEPESLLEPSHILSTKEIWALRMRHLLGTEHHIPLLKDHHAPHH